MPKVKSSKISAYLSADAGSVSIEVVINVNANGEFYCEIPEELICAFSIDGRFKDQTYDGKHLPIRRNRRQKYCIYCKDLEAIEKVLGKALFDINTPEVKDEHVIVYNIASEISFAVDENKQVHPNASFPGAKWDEAKERGKRYKSFENEMRGFSRSTSGGYVLQIGAQAMTKKTITIGDQVKITYSFYYKDGHHLGRENPAELLNSWTNITLDKKAKEIPYTDEAALFFHNLLMGMANISQRIQEATFDQENLLDLINSGNNRLLSS